MYVVDSNDRERILESREELFGILNSDEMRGVPVVVIANKQDLPSKEIERERFVDKWNYLMFTLSNISKLFQITLILSFY